MKKVEIKKKEQEIIDFVKSKIPDFIERFKLNPSVIEIHQDAFAADYQDDEFTLLGKAVKVCGIYGVDVKVIGTNRTTVEGTAQDGLNQQIAIIRKQQPKHPKHNPNSKQPIVVSTFASEGELEMIVKYFVETNYEDDLKAGFIDKNNDNAIIDNYLFWKNEVVFRVIKTEITFNNKTTTHFSVNYYFSADKDGEVLFGSTLLELNKEGELECIDKNDYV